MLKLIAFTAALTAISTYAEAGALPRPVENLVQRELLPFKSTTALRSPVAANNCADFSGHWVGTCHLKDQEQKTSFTIQQKGCESISFDGDKLDMGHNTVAADSSIFASANVMANTRFTQDGQTANALATVLVDSPFLPDSVSGRLGGELKKAGEGLALNGQIDLWMGMKSLASLPVQCEFTKGN